MITSNQKKTALYCRLSQDDNTENESNSIQNQKMILQRYAADHHFPNPCFYVDDGHTGLYIEERFPMFGARYIAINDSVDTDSSESNEPFKNLFNNGTFETPAARCGLSSRPRRSAGNGWGLGLPMATKRTKPTARSWWMGKPPPLFAGYLPCAPPAAGRARSPAN